MKNPTTLENQPGWLFLDENEAEKARYLFSDFEGVGTVDELGFGLLFDEIAEDLFPWCSTLTTRARYFFFSVAIIQRSLKKSVKPISQIEKLDRVAVYKAAADSGLRYQRNVREHEKYLGFMLHHKSPKAEGLFGRRKINRWCSEPERCFTKFQNILQNNTRYPNRIYRGSCQELGMFNGNMDEQRLLECAVKGVSPFNLAWSQVSQRVIDQTDYLFDRWEAFEIKSKQDQAISFKAVLAQLTPDLKRFSGFHLTKTEADFLFQNIVQRSSYLKDFSIKNLKQVLKNPELGLKTMAAGLKKSDDQNRFLSAYHVDQVTRPFREFYQAIVDRQSTENRPCPRPS